MPMDRILLVVALACQLDVVKADLSDEAYSISSTLTILLFWLPFISLFLFLLGLLVCALIRKYLLTDKFIYNTKIYSGVKDYFESHFSHEYRNGPELRRNSGPTKPASTGYNTPQKDDIKVENVDEFLPTDDAPEAPSNTNGYAPTAPDFNDDSRLFSEPSRLFGEPSRNSKLSMRDEKKSVTFSTNSAREPRKDIISPNQFLVKIHSETPRRAGPKSRGRFGFETK